MLRRPARSKRTDTLFPSTTRFRSTWELTAFLTDARGMTAVNSDFSGKITYHDSCSGLRELGVKAQPRRLLQSIPGVELTEMTEAEVCCGFGRSEEHTSELQSLMRISYAVFCLKNKNQYNTNS